MTDSSIPYAQALPTWLLVGQTHMKCQHVLQRDLRALDLSIAQHDVLVGIKGHEGLTQRQLADVLHVVKSNVTGLVQKLEQRGLVVRSQDSGDARSNRLSLTDAGRALVRRSLNIQKRVVTAMLAPLDANELAQLESVMERAGQALDMLPQANQDL